MSYFIKRDEKEETLLSGSPFKLRREYWHGNDAFSFLSCICISGKKKSGVACESKDNADTLMLTG